MRENRTCGSEGGEAQSLPYPYSFFMRRVRFLQLMELFLSGLFDLPVAGFVGADSL